MSLNRYIGYTKEELLARLRQVNDAIDRGNQTGAGIEPGVRHEFSEKSDAELRAILRDILKALYELDPENYDDPDGQKRMKITTVYPCSH